MNQFTASATYERHSVKPETGLDPAALSSMQGLLLPKEYGPVTPMSASDAMAFWTMVYDLRGVAFQSRGQMVVSDRVEQQHARDAKTVQAIEDAVTAERNRLARELHDAVTQTLFAASLIAEVLPDLWEMDQAEAHKSTSELRQLTRGALAEMRTLLFELRPAAMQQARLEDLLNQLSESLMGRQCLPVSLQIQGESEIPADVKVEIYRIAQESLNNIVKYARATQVEIRVQMEADQVHMQIQDNGIGFDMYCVKPTSLGLRIMRERADAIHAQLQVESQPGQGTTVRLDWHK